MSTATITIEYDEATQTMTCIASGDGEAYEIANEIMQVYQARDDHGEILSSGEVKVH